MRVLLFAYACEPDRGSEPGYGWNWAWHLAKLGYEIWALTCLDNKDKIEEALASQPMPNLHFSYIDVPVWVRRYVKGQIEVYTHYLEWQKQAYAVALQLEREHRFDILHHVTYGSVNNGSELWRLNKPLIFGPVGGGQIAPPAFRKYFLNHWNKEALRSFVTKRLIVFNRLARRTAIRADLVLVTNRDTADIAQRLGASRVEFFLDTGLPPDYFPQEPPNRQTSHELRLLWVGRLFPRKGLRLALESLSQVHSLIPFKLTILGNGFLSPYLAHWIKEFGLENKVEYRGQLSWHEVKQEYLDSDVFLFTSLRDSFGGQLLEAMAQSLPIITLDHHGAQNFVPDNAGIKVPVTEPIETVNAVAQAVEYMFRHPKERVVMGRAGYDFAKTQTWTHKAIAMSKYYEELAGKQLQECL